MEKKINGLNLRAVNYGERDRILTIFTLEEGLITAKIKGVKKADAKLKFASEPFCFAEYILSFSLNKNTVIGASLYDGFYPIRENFLSFYAGSVVLEFCQKFCLEGEPLKDLFMLATSTLKTLAYEEENTVENLIYFLLKGLSLVGYGLKTDGCFKCEDDIEGRVFFESSSGGFLCLDCIGEKGMEISRYTYAVLKNIGANQTLTIDGREFTDEEKQTYLIRALKLIDFYIEEQADAKIKSLKDLIAL